MVTSVCLRLKRDPKQTKLARPSLPKCIMKRKKHHARAFLKATDTQYSDRRSTSMIAQPY